MEWATHAKDVIEGFCGNTMESDGRRDVLESSDRRLGFGKGGFELVCDGADKAIVVFVLLIEAE